MAAAATLGCVRSAEAQAVRGQYGGGFIEYLVTGGPVPVARRPEAPEQGGLARHATAYGDGGPGAWRYANGDPYSGAEPDAPMPRTRLAALPAPPENDDRIGRVLDPRYERQVVAYEGRQAAGTIVIDTETKHLYLVQGSGRAIRYGIGVGRPGFLWRGVKTVSAKKEWPDWTPPPEMLLRRPDLPRHMEGGPANPLGARAMYLGSSLYRIHGTNEPNTIGQAVSSGCIRMMNEDVIDLYERTRVGARVEVI